MSSMTETIVVGVVVVVAGAWAAKAIWRSVRGGKVCSSCSSSEDCPMIAQQKNLAEISKLDHCGPSSFDCDAHRNKTDKS